MGDIRIVEATIKSLGAMEQIEYVKKNGSAGVFTKFAVECQIGDETHTYESPGWHRDKLAVGQRYVLDIEDKGQFTDSIQKVGLIGSAPPVAPSTPQIAPEPQVAPSEELDELFFAKKPLKPDFGARFREYNMHSRNAQIQATEKVGWYVKLALAGMLINSEGQKPDALTIGTIQYWHATEVDNYFKDYEMRVPRDMYGEWEE